MEMPAFTLLLNNAEADEHPAGSTIFEAGDSAGSMWVVKDGEVEIFVGNHHVETAVRGMLLGEMGLVTGEPRSARAVAKTDALLVPIDRKRFEFLVQQTPRFALQVMQVLVARLRRNENHD